MIIENTAPLFWNTVLGGLQAAAFVAMGRVFDQKSTHNVDRLLKLAQDTTRRYSQRPRSPGESRGRRAHRKVRELGSRLLKRIDWLKVMKRGGGLAFNVLTGLPSPDQIESILGGLRRCRATGLQLKWP